MADSLYEQHLAVNKQIITTDTKQMDEVLLNDAPVLLDAAQETIKKGFKRAQMKSLTRVQVHDKPVDEAPAGKNKKQLGALEKEERTRTGSDIQRLAFKRNLADNIAMDLKNSQLPPALKDILNTLKKYSSLDINAGSSAAERLHEQNTLYSAREGLTQLLAALGPEHEFDKLRDIVLLYKNYLALDVDGYLDQPKSEDIAAKKVKVLDATNNTIEATVRRKVREKDNNAKTVVVEKDIALEMRDASKESLFPHEPSVNDIRQGELGDCYLLAGLSAIVDASPQLIKDCMKDNGATVTVRFFEFEKLGAPAVPLYVTVSKVVPKNDTYASGSLWVQMIEQAYAASKIHLKRSGIKADYDGKTVYQDIAGGNSADFVQAMTGRISQRLKDPLSKQAIGGSSGIVSKGSRSAFSQHIFDKVNQERKDARIGGPTNVSEYEKKFFNLPHMTFKDIIDDALFHGNLTMLRGNIEDYLKSENKYLIHGINQETNKDESVIGKAYTIEDFLEMFDNIDIAKIPKVKELSDEENIKYIKSYLEQYRRYVTSPESELSHSPFSGKYSEHSEKTYQAIDEAIADGSIVTAGSYAFIPDSFKKGTGLNNEFEEAGHVERHAYTVLGVKTMGKNKYVKLRNPWGVGTRSYVQDAKTDNIIRNRVDDDTEGIFLLELNEFTTKFDQLAIN